MSGTGVGHEAKDADLAATALREANEELGLVSDHIQLLVALPVVKTQTTGFRIAPFLARLTVLALWDREEREVAKVVELRVAELAGPRCAPRRSVTSRPGWRRGGSGCGGSAVTRSGGDLPDPGAAGPTTPGR